MEGAVLNLADIVALIHEHEWWVYVAIFPLAVIEGPVLTVICGFWVTQGLLNPFLVYPLVVVGDAVGDFLIYLFGRYVSGWAGGKLQQKGFVSRLLRWVKIRLNITPEALEKARDGFNAHWVKALCFSKLGRGGAVLGLAYAGAIHFPYMRFALCCSLVSLGQSVVLLTLGITVGTYQETFHYLGIYGYAMCGLALVALFLTWRWLIKKTESQLE